MLLAILVTAVLPASAHAAGPDEVRVTRNVPYGTDQGGELALDVYQPPAATSPDPIVILIHGGGWTSGDKERYEPFSRSLAERGFVVFDINYSVDLGTAPGFPRQVNDVHAALTWVQNRAGQYGGDAHRIAVAGGSAGGYLAAMLGTQVNTSGSAPVRAVISLSGPMDLGALVTDLRTAVTSATGQCTPMSCDALNEAADSLRHLLGCEPLQCPDRLLREASPITYVTPASPPFFLANSIEEVVPASQATGMAAALRAQGVQVHLELVPGAQHSVAYVPAISVALLDFLTTHDGERSETTAATSPATDQSGQKQRRWPAGLLRWLVVGTAVLSLVGLSAARQHTSKAATPHDDPLEHPTTTEKR
jgi:triacylglycerol lipase/alpha-L-fucosidase 2